MTPSRRGLITGAAALAAYAALPRATDAQLLLGVSNGAGPPAPFGLVATGPHIANTSDATNKWLMARSHHVAIDTIASLQVAFANFIQGTNSQFEFGSGATTTVTASVEYPAGTFTQLLFSGSAQGTMASVPALGAGTENGSIISDAASVSIPNGADFWIRFYTTTTGKIWFDAGEDTANGELFAFGTTPGAGQDKTLGGTITDTASAGSFCAHPVCIIGRTNKPNAILIGDSIAWGAFSAAPSATDFFRRGSIVPGIPGTIPVLNLASSSSKAQTFASDSPGRMAIAAAVGGKYLINQLGTNDLFVAARTKAQLEADQQTLNALFSPTKIIMADLLPRTTSSGDWTTTGAQTVNGTVDPLRTGYNDDLRNSTTGISNIVGIFECADAVENARNGGKWAAHSPGLTDDGIHPNTTGNPLVTAAVATAYAALLT